MNHMLSQISTANRMRNGMGSVLEGSMNGYETKCSAISCKRRSRRDLRTIPIPPQSTSRPVSPTITVSLDRLLDALEFDPEWTPSAEAIRGYDDWEECHYPPATSEPDLNPTMDPECIECCRDAEELMPVAELSEEEPEPPPGEKRKKIVLGPDGEPDIISDIDSDEDECDFGIMANISPPVVLPKKELIYHVNVIGEDGCLEIDRVDEKHPLPNCVLRTLASESYSNFYPPLYVQGVCSDILDPDIPGPRWLGEEFDKTEEELERERLKEEQRKEDDLIEYEF